MKTSHQNITSKTLHLHKITPSPKIYLCQKCLAILKFHNFLKRNHKFFESRVNSNEIWTFAGMGER